MRDNKPGKIIIISSPSGGGKTSICRRLLSSARRRLGWRFSVSYTTRAKRRGERHGREYFFIGEDEFRRRAQRGFFAEHFKVHLYHYGTPRKPIEDVRRDGGAMLFDVDVQGAAKLKREYPDAISIFVLPPSQAELRRRLRRRGTETAEQLQLRLSHALQEMRTFRKYGFDYVVVNKELGRAVAQVLCIVEAHECRVDQTGPEQLRKLTG
ncbi:MAG: guanylate kinase [Candidatus Zixiibacteriota bacterium]